MSSDLIISRSVLNGAIKIPGSKSHTIRALVFAGLAEGESIIKQPLRSDDTISCINALKKMGVSFQETNRDGSLLKVRGTGGTLKEPDGPINIGNSGTTLRILTAVASLSGEKIHFDGDESIRKRPMQALLSSLYDLGAEVESSNGHAPLTVSGPIKGGKTMTDGISSQFLTSLLITCPLAENASEIKVIDLHEKPYVEMTLDWLDRLKIKYKNNRFKTFSIEGGQSYSPFAFAIPGDFSTATFHLVATAVTGGTVELKGLDMNDTQGDKRVVDILRKMGAGITFNPNSIIIQTGTLKGIDIDLNDIPDALPALAVAACAAEGETRLLNVAQARLKESDRIRVMCTELKKMGADISELENGLVIRQSKLHGTEVNGHDDHRVVMALGIAGMNADGETVIRNGSETAGITYPSFIEDFKKLGAVIRKKIPKI